MEDGGGLVGRRFGLYHNEVGIVGLLWVQVYLMCPEEEPGGEEVNSACLTQNLTM